ncbi:2-phospho-L-lactate transferase, partial [Dehalococcoidia bacterium]|nr:2-phospho-L-lactate transferase [Dehalococcoidia bacterium]
MTEIPKMVAIAGGVGGAKLAVGLARVLPSDALTITVNTGDDESFHGLHISPDLDTVSYALAGMTNRDTGWGVADDSFRTLAALDRLGAETWFKLGDVDMATHIRRTELIRAGMTLSEVTRELTTRLDIAHRVVPMSDDPVRTVILTDGDEMSFQEYFVEHQCEPCITGVRFEGAEISRPSPGFVEALESADSIVICPSNPVVSIGPILAVPGVREALISFRGLRVAVSPIVGGEALKGPAAKMMSELGEQVSCAGVARRYQGLCDVLVIDRQDAHEMAAVFALGIRPIVMDTIMVSEKEK